MNIPLNELQMWIALLALVLSTGTAAWNLLTTGHKRHAKDISDLRGDVAKSSKKIERLEQKVEALPNQEAIHRVEISLEKMAGDMKALSAGMQPIRQMAETFMASLADNARGRKDGH